ncbi:MAG: TRAP transporter large permease subunit, partial [Proteobacteria bacterium]|nr:TRAP transporter large permease subunit [Pseudomonadota bacterium]
MMTLYIIGFVIVFLLVLASGMPVGFGLGFLGMGLLIALSDMDTALGISMEKTYTAMDSSILVSIPLFVLAAQLIGESGMGKRLFDAAKTFLGKFKAGLGMATVTSSALFSAMTGSSFVAASTMGLIAIPELKRAKYPDFLTSAAITAGGSLGAVIPPSIILIIYGYLTDESIGKLFAAGMVPGILLVILYSIGIMLFSGSIGKETPGVDGQTVLTPSETGVAAPPERVMTKWVATKEAFWGLMAPVIILGGIYGGIFTATEAAAVAVIYCTFVGFFIYRTLNIKKLWAILQASGSVSCMIAMIVVGGAILSFPIIYGRIPQ